MAAPESLFDDRRLSFAALYSAVTPDYVERLRARLEPRRLLDCGFAGDPAEVDAGALAAAAMGGVVANASFLDVVDGLQARGECLCCCYARTAAQAADAESQIRLVLRYFDQDSYEKSASFYRVLGGLLRDTLPAEARAICRRASQSARERRKTGAPRGPVFAAATALSRVQNVCAVGLSHPVPDPPPAGILAAAGVALHVYSTPEGRRLLRRLARVCKTKSLALTIKIGAGPSVEFFRLRHKLRLHVLECHALEGRGGDQPADPLADPLADFWKCVKIVVAENTATVASASASASASALPPDVGDLGGRA